MAKKRGLGMGMDALFFENSSETTSTHTLRISEIEPNKSQPRIDFDEDAIATLADSIRQHGLLQPLLVRPLESGGYQIVAGERRWRACRMAGLDEVPVYIRELSDQETMQVALIENLQRENLNPIEEALGYQDLIDNYNMTQEEVAKTVGKSRSVIANCLRALKLEQEIQDMLRNGEITIGHAKALAGVESSEMRIELAKKCKEDMLTVRNLEKLCAKIASEGNNSSNSKEKKQSIIDSYFREVELALNQELGRKVTVNSKKNKGTIEIEFYNKDDLAELAKLLAKVTQ
jgi:ParB family chromosome partitioning protein